MHTYICGQNKCFVQIWQNTSNGLSIWPGIVLHVYISSYNTLTTTKLTVQGFLRWCILRPHITNTTISSASIITRIVSWVIWATSQARHRCTLWYVQQCSVEGRSWCLALLLAVHKLRRYARRESRWRYWNPSTTRSRWWPLLSRKRDGFLALCTRTGWTFMNYRTSMMEVMLGLQSHSSRWWVCWRVCCCSPKRLYLRISWWCD